MSVTDWAFFVAQTVKNLPIIQETGVRFLSQEDPLDKEMATHSSILAGTQPARYWNSTHSVSMENSMDSRAWWAIVHGVTKTWTRLSH